MMYSTQEQPADGIPLDCTPIFDGWRIPGNFSPSPQLHVKPIAATFDEFINPQPEHIAALLPRIRWYCQDVYDFCNKASDLNNILLVTDGGALETTGSFGWSIGTNTRIQQADGSGPVFGFDPRLYRAETYGCRSGMFFF